jgi:5-methylcytosine-specific restriction endonuclease McrA
LPGEDGTAKYQCPICCKWFDHTDIDDLQGDHVWPYSLFGDTAWENYQLICGRCNAAKGNYMETELRRAIGRGDFREMVVSHLRRLLDDKALAETPYIRQMVGR